MLKKVFGLFSLVLALFNVSNASAYDVTPGQSGSWYDPSHSGEGYFLQVLSPSQAAVFWFTYDKNGDQFWMIGVGDINGSKITFPELLSPHGGKFGPDFNPEDVEYPVWGSMEFDFSSCDAGKVSYVGPPAFGSGSLNLIRLTYLWGLDCQGNDLHPQSNGQGYLSGGFSGSWYDLSHSGEGFVIEVINETTAAVIWFSYDSEGNPAWMLGVGEIFGSTIIINDIQITSGGIFGPTYNKEDVVYEPWGSAIHTFGSCQNGGMRYLGPESFGPESTQITQRLTLINGTECKLLGSLHTASGKMGVAKNTYIDGDTNDPNTPFSPNNGNDNGEWQDLFTPAYVAGFATKAPTGEQGQRFENESDQGDLYRIGLRKGERISLSIANSDLDADGGDLDLWLYNVNNTDTPADSSLGTGSEEMVHAPETGEYFLWVWADEGKSNYTLRTGWDITSQASTLTVNSEMVTDQVMVGHKPVSEFNLTSGPNQKSKKYSLDRFNTDLQLSRLSSNSDGSALYEITAPYVDMASAFEFPLAERGFGISDYRKWVAVLTSKKILREKGVRYAGPNYVSKLHAIPNDYFYPYQWHYKSIDMEKAWDVTKGSKNVVVAVIDSGVAEVPDLAGNVDYSLGFDFVTNSFLSPSGDGDGWDFNARDPGPQGAAGNQRLSHGTHVAGTIGALSNNGIGVAGVNWNVTIMPIRAGAEGFSCDALDQSLRWSGRLPNATGYLPAKKADIVNMSLGGSAPCPNAQDLINQLRSEGIIVIVSAGNCGWDDSCTRLQPMYPASLDGVVSVSATNRADKLAPYSNYGTKIDVSAPGGNSYEDLDSDGIGDLIWSTTIARDAYSFQTYLRYDFPAQGTSMAAPHVAGVAALMKSVFPEMTATDFDYALASGEITDDLARNGLTVRDAEFGYGRINANKAVNWAIGASNSGQRETFITSSASVLDFGPSETGLLIDVQKSGPDNIKFTTWYREHDWVSLEAVNTDANAFGTIRVVVDRSNLQRGQYRSNLWFEADNKSIVRISINLQVGESVAGQAGSQYALLLDAYTLTPQYWWSGAQISDSYNINFSSVVSGYYYLLVGSDMNGDGFICDVGEFCRLYPTENDPVLIEINNGNYAISNFTMTVPNPRAGVSQASAVLVKENGDVDQSTDTLTDFKERFGKTGWKINR